MWARQLHLMDEAGESMMVRRRPRKRYKAWSFPLIRDIVLFIAGLAGLAYETIFTTIDRPTLLLLYAAMLGLPAFLQANNDRAADEKEISDTIRRQIRFDETDEKDDLVSDTGRKEDLLAELKEIESRERKRRSRDRDEDDDPPVRRLPRRDPDENGDNGDHPPKRRAR